MSLAAVWSFWSPPYLASRQASWAHDWFHWLAWGLSVHTAAQHYPETRLVTDSRGAHVLVDLLAACRTRDFRSITTAVRLRRLGHQTAGGAPITS